MSLPSDIRVFLDLYPHVEDDPTLNANHEFYLGNLRCQPDDHTIDEIHEKSLFSPSVILWSLSLFNSWFGDYDKLEYKHGYIQWLCVWPRFCQVRSSHFLHILDSQPKSSGLIMNPNLCRNTKSQQWCQTL